MFCWNGLSVRSETLVITDKIIMVLVIGHMGINCWTAQNFIAVHNVKSRKCFSLLKSQVTSYHACWINLRTMAITLLECSIRKEFHISLNSISKATVHLHLHCVRWVYSVLTSLLSGTFTCWDEFSGYEKCNWWGICVKVITGSFTFIVISARKIAVKM